MYHSVAGFFRHQASSGFGGTSSGGGSNVQEQEALTPTTSFNLYWDVDKDRDYCKSTSCSTSSTDSSGSGSDLEFEAHLSLAAFKALSRSNPQLHAQLQSVM